MERRYITTPIYYVNDVPHIGHAYTTVAADVDARLARQGLGNDNVYFLTGTDEHGSKIAQAAAEQGVPTQQFVDQNAAAFKAAWKLLNVSNNDFIRTTEPRHVLAVQQILRQLRAAKAPDGQLAVYEGEYEGLYCGGCEKFLLPSELVDGLCPDHPKWQPQVVKEKNWFFRLSAYLGQVEEKVNSDVIKIVPTKKKAEVLGLIRQLRETKDGGDFSISRESVTWGIDLPSEYGSATQKAYVWVDALTNYITALGYGSSDDALFQKFWADEKTTVVHYLAQDIIKFHAVYWPAILLALDIFRPLELRVHSYFTIAGQKMGKSLGNAIPPQQLVDRYGVDATRWLLATGFPFGSESDISLAKFDERYTAELANLLGNHASRVTDLITKFAGGELTGTTKLLDVSVLQQLHTDSVYLQEQKPWLLAKNDQAAAAAVVNEVGLRLRDSILRAIASIIPTTAARVTTALAARPISKLEPLFPRLIT